MIWFAVMVSKILSDSLADSEVAVEDADVTFPVQSVII
jgi:hypothetical protein